MLSVSTIKPLSTPEATLKIQRHFYSRHSRADFRFWCEQNDFQAKINVFASKFRWQSATLKSFNIKHHSAKILKSWSQQFEYVVSDRVRKGFQLIALYNKWWGSLTSNLSLQKFASELLKGRRFYFTVCLAPIFRWEENRIAVEELSKLEVEIDNAKKLYINDGNNEKTDIDTLKPNCGCNRCRHLDYDGWTRLYTEKNLKIWRKEHADYPGKGLYVYKVFGHYPDVTAADFFRVQIDVDYRKKWDSNSVQLNIVESDRQSNSDILYWEFLFPRMFHNRDYVCNRRFSIDPEKKLYTIICESIDHPSCPEKPPIHRVKEYWSHTVIRSTANTPEEPGIEFTFTYFDNPEVIIPNYITLWYTVVGMPEYMKSQRDAAVALAEMRAKSETYLSGREVTSESKTRKELQPPEKRVLLL